MKLSSMGHCTSGNVDSCISLVENSVHCTERRTLVFPQNKSRGLKLHRFSIGKTQIKIQNTTYRIQIQNVDWQCDVEFMMDVDWHQLTGKGAFNS